MTWLSLVIAALGGGVVTWLLELSVTSVRNFETARLLLIAELTMISSALTVSSQIGRDVPLPTAAWETQRHLLARPIAKRDQRLWAGITVVYSSIIISAHLGTSGEVEVNRVLEELKRFSVGRVRRVVAYGPRFFWKSDPAVAL